MNLYIRLFRFCDSPIHTLNDSPVFRSNDSSDYMYMHAILLILRLWLNRRIVKFESQQTIFPILLFSNAHSKRFSNFQIIRSYRVYTVKSTLRGVHLQCTCTSASFFKKKVCAEKRHVLSRGKSLS